MIIVISNRNLRAPLDGKPKPFSTLGKDLGNGNLYAKVVKRNTCLELYDEQNKHKLFDKLANKIRSGDAKLNRPWVVFLHGNNQTTAKNISKAIDIERLHKVNVIAFSWPSQPYTGKEDAMLKLIKKEAVKKLIREIGGNNIVNIALSKLAEKSEEYLRNYLLARINAEKSPPHFAHAMQVVNNMLVKKTGKRMKLSFLCHSLGHYLLQNTMANHKLPVRFKNIILHQADVDACDHETWVRKLHPRSDKIYITTNQYDYVLMASKFVNRKERLGQTRQFYNCRQCIYLDFSDAANTSDENEHEFFRLDFKGKGSYTNQAIYTQLGRLMRSEKPQLTAAGGFRKKGPNLYRLAEIISPIDDEIVSS